MHSSISVSDRSFNYGDGIFTTIRVSAGVLQLWPLHLQRLQHGATKLGFGIIDWDRVAQLATSAVSQSEQVIKILISRGEGGRGYGCNGLDQPAIYVTASAMPDYSQYHGKGMKLGLANLQLAVQPALAGLKHNNRLEQVMLKQELQQQNDRKQPVDDLLVLDTQGYITEATAANLMFYKNGSWFTPQLHRAGVAGVMRQYIMQRIEVEEVNWTLQQLETIEEMVICNALMGIISVQSFEQHRYSLSAGLQLHKQVLC